MGQYHPHGDASLYETLVRMTHLRYPLVFGDGNFGRPDCLVEKPPAAHRYTECSLDRLGDSFFRDIHVVDMIDNFDETAQEPICLPAIAPWALINGTDSIGVGLSASIPPHNLGEVVRACRHLLENPEATTEDLLEFIKGPDYGTGVLIAKKQELLDLYETGEGQLQFDSSYSVEPGKKTNKLVVTGLAPGITKPHPKRRTNNFFTVAAELAAKKLVEGPVTDESVTDKKGAFQYRDTISYRDPQIVRDRLLPLLRSKVSYSWIMLDPDGQARRFNLLDVISTFLDFRRDVETKVLQDQLTKQQRRLDIVTAKYRAVQKIDEVAQILKTAKTAKAASKKLMELLRIKREAAEQLLDTPLRSLMRMQSDDLKQQGQKLKQEIKTTKQQLRDIDAVVGKRLDEVEKWSDSRGTRLRSRQKDFGEDQSYWVGVTPDGKIDVSLDLPLRSRAAWNYCSFFRTDGEFVVVHDTNQAQVVHVSYVDRYEPNGVVVGATARDACLVVTATGRYVAFKTKQKRPKFPVLKDLGDDTLVAAIGIDSTTRALVQQDSGQIHYLEEQDLKISRPNVKAKKLGMRDVRRALEYPEDAILMGPAGELGEPESADEFWVVGQSNLMSLQKGVRKVVSWQDAVDYLDNVQTVVPIEDD